MRQRRLLSLFLSVVLLFGGMPAPALAEALGHGEEQDLDVVLLDSDWSDDEDAAASGDSSGADLSADDEMGLEDDESGDKSGGESDDQKPMDADEEATDEEPEAATNDESSNEGLAGDAADAATAADVAEPTAPTITTDSVNNADDASGAGEEAAEAAGPALDDESSITRVYGYKDDPILVRGIHDENEEPTVETLNSLPSKFSSVNQGNITPVRDQYPFGACWAFSSMASIEASALRNGLTLGYNRHNMDLSERHLAYFAYHTATDPLKNTAGDRTYNTSQTDHYLNVGGNNMLALLTLTSWQGVAYENVASYKRLVEASNRYWSNSDLLAATSLNKNIAYRDIYHVNGGYFIPSNNRSDVKWAIQRYGAVAASYYDDSDYYNSYTGAYYNNRNTTTNHAVTIVGWDDNYSPYNFRTIPSRPGAWLVKNSWGRNWGNSGYFWLSYQDTSIGQNVLAYTVENAKQHQNIYQYDGSASPWNETIRSGGKVANVFKAKAGKQGEWLEAVSFLLWDVNVNYSIQIYLNPTNSSKPTSGSPALATPIQGKTKFEGFYKVNLSEKVPLIAGTKYAVVITLSKSNGDPVTFATDETYTRWGYVSNVKQKQGFVYESGSGWKDLYSKYSNPANARIKAYTSNANLTARTKIQNASVSVPNKTYTGKRLYPKATVYFGRIVLRKGTDYSVTYKNNLHAGTGKVIIKGKGRYSGTKTVTFKIKRKSIAKAKVKVDARVQYTGRACKPSVTVKLGRATLKRNKHYVVKYANNVQAGTATVKVIGKGDYHGTKKTTFQIVRKGYTVKRDNTLRVSTKAKTVSVSKVKSKAVTVKPIVVKNAQGTVRYRKLSGSGALTVNRKTGKVTVKKGTKRGVYRAKVKVRAAGNSSYYAGSKTVTIKVTVKKVSTSSKLWEKEPNNYYDNATRLPLNTDMYGRSDFPDDDRFVVTVPATGYYTIRITRDGKASEGSLYVWTRDANHDSYYNDFSISLSQDDYVWHRFKLKKGKNYIWIWGSTSLSQYPYHIRIYR